MNPEPMEEDNIMESSPMDQVFSRNDSMRGSKSCSKRKYQEDSGYGTTPGSSQSTFAMSWGMETLDEEGFVESPRGQKKQFWSECSCSKDWEDWEKGTPLLSSTSEAAITLPAHSPTQPKVPRSRDLPRSGSDEFVIRRPAFLRRPNYVHSRTDFVHRFAVASNFEHILNLIFSYLSDSDITTMSMVSKTWYQVISNNTATQERRLNDIASRKCCKENLNLTEKSSWMRSPLKTRNHSTPIHGGIPMTPSSPPCSPSKFKFNLFRKEAEKLKEGEWLMHCPACDLPCKCTPLDNLGKCVRVNCSFEFCTLCRNPYHQGSPCVLLSPPGDRTPHKHISRAQSKRNLRRLL